MARQLRDPQPIDYRATLHLELMACRERNGAYSLRAFSRRLGVSPATLSQLLSGKRHLGPRVAARIAERMDLSPVDCKAFLASAAAKKEQDTAAEDKAKPFDDLELERFAVIADWRHYAILSLAHIVDNRSDPRWIARRLGIAKTDAARALARLCDLKLITVERGHMRRAGNSLTTPANHGNLAIRKYHRQILRRADEALDRYSTDERDFGAITFAFDPKRMEEAKTAIRRFRRTFDARFETAEASVVFVLATQLFTLEANLSSVGETK